MGSTLLSVVHAGAGGSGAATSGERRFPGDLVVPVPVMVTVAAAATLVRRPPYSSAGRASEKR